MSKKREREVDNFLLFTKKFDSFDCEKKSEEALNKRRKHMLMTNGYMVSFGSSSCCMLSKLHYKPCLFTNINISFFVKCLIMPILVLVKSVVKRMREKKRDRKRESKWRQELLKKVQVKCWYRSWDSERERETERETERVNQLKKNNMAKSNKLNNLNILKVKKSQESVIS